MANFFKEFGKDVSDTISVFTGNYGQIEDQRQLNKLTMEREDNAYQRAVEDAKKAGLSPLSITGGADASSMQSARMDNSGALSFGANILGTMLDRKSRKEANENDRFDANTNRMNAIAHMMDSVANVKHMSKSDSLIEKQIEHYDDEVNSRLALNNSLKDKYGKEIEKIDADMLLHDKEVQSLIGLRDKQVQLLSESAKKVTRETIAIALDTNRQEELFKLNRVMIENNINLSSISVADAKTKLKYAETLLSSMDELYKAQAKNLKANEKIAWLNTFVNAITRVGGLALSAYGMSMGSPIAPSSSPLWTPSSTSFEGLTFR